MKSLLQKLLPIEWIGVFYLILTGLLSLIFYGKTEFPVVRILFRIIVLGGLFGLVYLTQKQNNKWWIFLRSFYFLILLSFFYTETDAFNNIFSPNLDRTFALWEVQLFKCQPSLLFYYAAPWPWFNELMSLAYFSFFPLIISLCFVSFFKKKAYFGKIYFILITSFFIYYILFIFLPVAGPQFYFPAPFNHTPKAYIFSHVMHFINTTAEKPTAAFPSSHVGITIILWFLIGKNFPKLLWIYIPMGILLFFSTIYLKAHYVIDVIGGIISAPLIYIISKWMYSLFPAKENPINLR